MRAGCRSRLRRVRPGPAADGQGAERRDREHRERRGEERLPGHEQHHGEHPGDEGAEALTQLGWHVGDGPVPVSAILELPGWRLLANIGSVAGPRADRHDAFSPKASALAREVLTS